MPTFESIEKIVSETVSVIDSIETLSKDGDKTLSGCKDLCLNVPGYIQSGLIKIAVVGVIKSGKSTLVNALTGKELVKRGAGVVTSITTRIRKGRKNRAVIHLKSWDEINLEIEKALDMFPENQELQNFDIRRKKDRAYLQTVYDALSTQFPVTSEGIRPETVLIRNALEGYKSCSDIIDADEREIYFESKTFDNHKQFTADSTRAFYVKDVCLEVYGKTINPNLEIADCQGTDSTDPSQMAQIISYLESANLILYCISSRTGLRQSDMAFLKRLKRLGLMSNIIFINNCDLSEHENQADIESARDKLLKELTLLVPQPQLFSFSALYTLFNSLGNRLSQRNAKRLSLWQDDKHMVGFCENEYKLFISAYNQLLENKRYDLLYANHLNRLRIVADTLEKKADVITDILNTDLADQDKAKEHLKGLEDNAKRLRVIVDNSVQGAVSGLTNEIQGNLKNAFLKDSVNINRMVAQFINQTKIDPEPYRAGVKETGFKQILYLMFQDFKRELDIFSLEQVVPELKRLVLIQEKRIEDYFQSLLDSYRIDFLGMSNLPISDGNTFSLELLENETSESKAVDLQAIKKILGLSLPDQIFSAKFTTRMRANALTDFSIHSFVLFISALVDKHIHFSFTPGLDRAGTKIKKECLVLIRQQIKGYHLNLRNNYFSPLIEAVTRDFKEKILQRFTMYETLNRDMEHLFSLKQDEKNKNLEKVLDAKTKINQIRLSLDSFSLHS